MSDSAGVLGEPSLEKATFSLIQKVFFLLCFVLFLKIIYLFIYQRQWAQAEWQAEAEGEAGSLLSKEPDVGLDPRTLGSWPELKAAP